MRVEVALSRRDLRSIQRLLINRGNVTMRIEVTALASPSNVESERGRPRLCSEALIQTSLGLETVCNLPPRSPYGFAQSVRNQLLATLPVNYASLSRHAQTLDVQLSFGRDSDPVHLVDESTDAKDNGKGEWKVYQHCDSMRLTWCNVHIVLDANTNQVRVALMTYRDVADRNVLQNCSARFRPTDSLIPWPAMVLTAPSHVMLPMRQVVQHPVSRRARVLLTGTQPCLAPQPATKQSVRLPNLLAEKGKRGTASPPLAQRKRNIPPQNALGPRLQPTRAASPPAC